MNNTRPASKSKTDYFFQGSIFQIIANDEDDDANVCLNIEAAWEYLGGVWTLGHAVWVQAYKIKHKNDYSAFATQKKDAAMSKMEDFSRVKDLAYPDHCHCFLKGEWVFKRHVNNVLLDYQLSNNFNDRSCRNRNAIIHVVTK